MELLFATQTVAKLNTDAAHDETMTSLDIDRPDLLTFAGVGLTLLGAFLPWRTAAAPADAATKAGIEGIGFLAVAVALGVFATAAVLRHDRTSALVAVGGGLLVTLLGLFEYLRLDGPIEPGIGLFLTAAAGLVVVAGGALGVSEYS